MKFIGQSIFILLIISILGCEKSKPNNGKLENATKLKNLEYAVYNQTLSFLGEDILYNHKDYSFLEKFEIERFNERFEVKDKTKLFERIKSEGIDTSKVYLSKIDFLILPDSLDEKSGLPKKEFKIDKINHPVGIILIKENDKIRELDFFIKSLRLSRIVFNKTKTKAEFEIEIVRGLMNGKGMNVKCELRNGAWVIVKTKTTWVS
ncbi:hypothetical protein JAO71_15280 [Olleya sp. YSTF-M6]|uniref:Lipoprotein n=1 Tax=Olleya sediminilitoris TaxID=2795739 RepID=A0ABS1WPY5_9FLAO|nr:hypothetical protein [Olleya sediminilitoris]MBL7561163.1 hypothetical protein [Olleya sediminilitoris]